VKLTTHLHLVPRSRMCGAIPSLLQYVFIAQGQLYFVNVNILLYADD